MPQHPPMHKLDNRSQNNEWRIVTLPEEDRRKKQDTEDIISNCQESFTGFPRTEKGLLQYRKLAEDFS